MSRLYKAKQSKAEPVELPELKKQLIYVDIRKQ
jgi:hypothetical protein